MKEKDQACKERKSKMKAQRTGQASMTVGFTAKRNRVVLNFCLKTKYKAQIKKPNETLLNRESLT